MAPWGPLITGRVVWLPQAKRQKKKWELEEEADERQEDAEAREERLRCGTQHGCAQEAHPALRTSQPDSQIDSNTRASLHRCSATAQHSLAASQPKRCVAVLCVRRREEARLRDQAEKAEFEERLRAKDEQKTKKLAESREPKKSKDEERREAARKRCGGRRGR